MQTNLRVYACEKSFEIFRPMIRIHDGIYILCNLTFFNIYDKMSSHRIWFVASWAVFTNWIVNSMVFNMTSLVLFTSKRITNFFWLFPCEIVFYLPQISDSNESYWTMFQAFNECFNSLYGKRVLLYAWFILFCIFVAPF